MFFSKIKTFYQDNKSEVIVSLIFLFFAFGFNVYRVQGDGVVYYAILEKTLHLSNPESTAGALKIGFMQSGSSFFNIPFYLSAYFIEKVLGLHINSGGITLRTISINIASNFYLLLSIVLVIKILRRLKFKSTMLPVLFVLFSSPAFSVSTIMPSYNHSVDIFVTTCLFYYFVIMIESNTDNKIYSFILGLIYVISLTIRYFNFIYFIPFSVYLLYSKDYNKLKYFVLGILSLCWILPLIFYIYNGNPFYPFMVSDMGSAVTQRMSWYPQYALKYLLHPMHGLFIWSPVLLLSMVGLYFYSKEEIKHLGTICLCCFVLLLFINGFNPEWHAGWSFSNRYFAGLFPIYALGLASLFEYRYKIYKYAGSILTVFSFILFLNWNFNTIHGDWGTVVDLFSNWKNGYSETFYEGTLNIKNFGKRVYEGTRYKYFIKLFVRS